METPTHYKNGLPQLPYQEAEAAQALAGSELLQEVDMIAPYTQDTKLASWQVEQVVEQDGYEFTVLALGPIKRLLYQPSSKHSKQ